MLDDPAHFDIDAINRALRAPFFALREAGVNPDLVDLVNRLAYSPVGEDLTARAVRLLGDPARVGEADLRDSLRAFTWFLERAADDGIPLTAAGYMKPADVEAAAQLVPMMDGWIGKANREIDTAPVLTSESFCNSSGCFASTRERSGSPSSARRPTSSSDALWSILVGKLINGEAGFDGQAALLVLAYSATSAGAEIRWTALRRPWGTWAGRPVAARPIAAHDLYWLPALEILDSVKSTPSSWRERRRISPPAAALAHTALRASGASTLL